MDERPPQVEEIEAIIRRYLHEHPQAVDTERGIHEWWLRQAGRTYALADVHAAIQELVASGELAERRLPDGRSIYASAGTPQSHQS